VFGTHSQSEGKSTIGSHTCCHIAQGAAIEDFVFIAPFFMGANVRRITHGRSIPKLLDAYKIKYGARIGVSVTVLPGITIGGACGGRIPLDKGCARLCDSLWRTCYDQRLRSGGRKDRPLGTTAQEETAQ